LDGGSQFGDDRKTIFMDIRLFEIWRELALHYFWAEYIGGSRLRIISDLSGTGSTLFFWWIVLEASDLVVMDRLFFPDSRLSEIWRELALNYFPADCFGINFFQII
jgi:hypothetical protein